MTDVRGTRQYSLRHTILDGTVFVARGTEYWLSERQVGDGDNTGMLEYNTRPYIGDMSSFA